MMVGFTEKVAPPVCHMTKRCKASIVNDKASPFWDENLFTVDFCDFLMW